MRMSGRRMLGGILALAVVGVGGSIAATDLADDHEKPITGEALGKASAAALAFTQGGHVTETEVGDEDSYYEVEVTLPGGRQVDVQLDRDFKVVGAEPDSETGDN